MVLFAGLLLCSQSRLHIRKFITRFISPGVTFDAGGISIKPSLNMDAMRADMGGGACTLAALWGVAKLQLPVNVRAYIPLAENLPSGL